MPCAWVIALIRIKNHRRGPTTTDDHAPAANPQVELLCFDSHLVHAHSLVAEKSQIDSMQLGVQFCTVTIPELRIAILASGFSEGSSFGRERGRGRLGAPQGSEAPESNLIWINAADPMRWHAADDELSFVVLGRFDCDEAKVSARALLLHVQPLLPNCLATWEIGSAAVIDLPAIASAGLSWFSWAASVSYSCFAKRRERLGDA
jgi:hypothetical protein